jgi:phage shock protein A
MEEKIVTNEKRIQASAEIDEEFSGDRLANDFKRLEKTAGTVGVDQQLLALKQKMGMLPAAAPQTNRQLGTGGAKEETVHAEIEDLRDEK